MRNVASLYQVYHLSGSSVQLGLAGFFQAFPFIIFGLFGGVLADTLNRKKLIAITHALNILPGIIVAISPGEGPTVEVGIDCNGATVLARITEQSRQALNLRLGGKVFAVIKTVSFDRANTGAGLPAEADG